MKGVLYRLITAGDPQSGLEAALHIFVGSVIGSVITSAFLPAVKYCP